MANQQSIRESRRNAFQSLTLGQLSPPKPSGPPTGVYGYQDLRRAYIEGYCRRSRHESIQEPWQPHVSPKDDLIVPRGQPSWQGPNIDWDIMSFNMGYMTEPEPFHKNTSHLVCMYGMGLKELQFVARNPNLTEREEQLETLELYHILKFLLGASNVADLTEQLEFCFYAIKHSRPAWMKTLRPSLAPGAPSSRMWNGRAQREGQAKRDRQREFQIAKVMADRLWEQFLIESLRITPIILRSQKLPSGRRREGDWRNLTLDEQYRLLGAEDTYYKRHPLFLQLATQWLPSLHPPYPLISLESRLPDLPTLYQVLETAEPVQMMGELRHAVVREVWQATGVPTHVKLTQSSNEVAIENMATDLRALNL